MKEEEIKVTRRTFLRVVFVAVTGYSVLGPGVLKAAENSSEPNDYWFDSQRLMFGRMQVLSAFSLEDELERQGKFANLTPVRIGFVDYSGIVQIADEFPPVPGWDIANQKPIPDEGVYEITGSNNELLDHATKVASIAISKINNWTGIAGLCGRIPITVRQAKFYKNVLDPEPADLFLDALEYFTVPENYVDVLNITTGGEDSPALVGVVKRLNKLNTVVVASAGNENSNQAQYPAAYSDVISVGAIRLKDNEKHEWSNFGKIDMAAYSDVYALTSGEDRKPILTTVGITSAAAPQISSLAVHLKFFRRDLSPTDIKEIMQSTGIPVAGSYNWRLPNYQEAIMRILKAA